MTSTTQTTQTTGIAQDWRIGELLGWSGSAHHGPHTRMHEHERAMLGRRTAADLAWRREMIAALDPQVMEEAAWRPRPVLTFGSVRVSGPYGPGSRRVWHVACGRCLYYRGHADHEAAADDRQAHRCLDRHGHPLPGDTLDDFEDERA